TKSYAATRRPCCRVLRAENRTTQAGEGSSFFRRASSLPQKGSTRLNCRRIRLAPSVFSDCRNETNRWSWWTSAVSGQSPPRRGARVEVTGGGGVSLGARGFRPHRDRGTQQRKQAEPRRCSGRGGHPGSPGLASSRPPAPLSFGVKPPPSGVGFRSSLG